MAFQLFHTNLNNEEHIIAFLKLLNAYLLDKMGIQQPLSVSHGQRVINDLKEHPTFCGFLAMKDGEWVGMANCFINYSTFQAKRLLNIHDFIVLPEFRKQGVGSFILKQLADYAQNHNFCRINLEVREDNFSAQSLYRRHGFRECSPRMFFWENNFPMEVRTNTKLYE